MLLLEILHHTTVISVPRLHGQGEPGYKERGRSIIQREIIVTVGKYTNTLVHDSMIIVVTYVWADAGLLVTLHTLYFLLTGPVCVTSTFSPMVSQKQHIIVHVQRCAFQN